MSNFQINEKHLSQIPAGVHCSMISDQCSLEPDSLPWLKKSVFIYGSNLFRTFRV